MSTVIANPTARQVLLPPPPRMDVPQPDDAHRLFVYGTLRKGHGNHVLLKDATFLGVRHTQPEYTMMHLGGFPGVIVGGKTSIVGEVYEVTDPAQLKRIDRLEGHPGWYVRTPVVTLEGDSVEIYLYPPDDAVRRNARVVESGDWHTR